MKITTSWSSLRRHGSADTGAGFKVRHRSTSLSVRTSLRRASEREPRPRPSVPSRSSRAFCAQTPSQCAGDGGPRRRSRARRQGCPPLHVLLLRRERVSAGAGADAQTGRALCGCAMGRRGGGGAPQRARGVHLQPGQGGAHLVPEGVGGRRRAHVLGLPCLGDHGGLERRGFGLRLRLHLAIWGPLERVLVPGVSTAHHALLQRAVPAHVPPSAGADVLGVLRLGPLAHARGGRGVLGAAPRLRLPARAQGTEGDDAA
eukprot:scaffold301_cov243-Pinguiococcus_pyrenoidosus.AAC.34